MPVAKKGKSKHKKKKYSYQKPSKKKIKGGGKKKVRRSKKTKSKDKKKNKKKLVQKGGVPEGDACSLFNQIFSKSPIIYDVYEETRDGSMTYEYFEIDFDVSDKRNNYDYADLNTLPTPGEIIVKTKRYQLKKPGDLPAQYNKIEIIDNWFQNCDEVEKYDYMIVKSPESHHQFLKIKLENTSFIEFNLNEKTVSEILNELEDLNSLIIISDTGISGITKIPPKLALLIYEKKKSSSNALELGKKSIETQDSLDDLNKIQELKVYFNIQETDEQVFKSVSRLSSEDLQKIYKILGISKEQQNIKHILKKSELLRTNFYKIKL